MSTSVFHITYLTHCLLKNTTQWMVEILIQMLGDVLEMHS